MKIILNKDDLIKSIYKEKNLGFVPTMGAIHLGHVSLIRKSNALCNKTIVSIFVNKPQFNKKKDYKKYPRVIKKDISKLKSLNVNFLYMPSFNDIYPFGPSKNIRISSFSKKLCGKSRRGHLKLL